jgi:thiol-disulfide isomerase/thioredoxin
VTAVVSHRLAEGGRRALASIAAVRCGVGVAAMAAMALGAVLLAACSSAGAPASSTLNLGTTVFPAAGAPRVPPVAGHLVGGGELSLAAYRGRVVVVNFWGSWCTICRQEAPALSVAARDLQGSGVRFVGVDVSDSTASAEAFMKDFRIHYPSLSDPGDAVALRFSKIIPITAFPSTLVISPGGRVAGRIIGAVSARNLMKLVEIAQARAGSG